MTADADRVRHLASVAAAITAAAHTRISLVLRLLVRQVGKQHNEVAGTSPATTRSSKLRAHSRWCYWVSFFPNFSSR
jgi:hypothetical protein